MAVDSNANDELLQLKKRARRRLVGAVALMLVSLIVLSVVMGTRPAPVDKPEPIAIDGLGANAVAPETNAFAKPTVTEVAASETVASAAAETHQAVKPSKSLEEHAAPVVKKPEETVKPKSAEPKIAESKPTPAAKAKPKNIESKKPVEEDKPKAKKPVERTPVEKESKPAELGKQYSASVAALSDPAKAAELQRKLSAQGLKSYTEKIDVGGKTLTRVKVGPYNNAADLSKARAKLASMGL